MLLTPRLLLALLWATNAGDPHKVRDTPAERKSFG